MRIAVVGVGLIGGSVGLAVLVTVGAAAIWLLSARLARGVDLAEARRLLWLSVALLSITDALTSHLTIDDFFWTTIWAAIILAIAAVVVEMILQLIFWREPVVAA